MDKKIREFVLENLREFSTTERPIYLVGGAVRDQLLDLPVHDLDFVMPGSTLRLAQDAARRLDGALYILDEERNTTRVVLAQEKIGGKPGERLFLDFSVLRSRDIIGDLQSRDFTINAMAYDINYPNKLIDPTGGFGDLREKRIRVCSPESLSDDPVRILRAVRQAIKYGFRIDPDTFQQMKSVAPRIKQVSSERVRDELFRMLDGPHVALAVRILERSGALAYILPEMDQLRGVSQSAPHISDVWEHTINVVDHLEKLYIPLVGKYQEEMAADLTVGSAVLWLGRYRDAYQQHFSNSFVPDRSLRSLLFFAALYHDISKPETREETAQGRIRFLQHQEKGAMAAAERGRQLMLSTHEVDRIESIVRHHMRVHFMANIFQSPNGSSPSRRVIYRYFQDTGPAGVDIGLLSLADVRGTYGVTLPQNVWESELAVYRSLLDAYWDHADEVVSPPRIISGHEVMDFFGLPSGKLIGKLLGTVREAQAAGEISSREDAIAFIREYLENPLNGVSFTQAADAAKEEGEE